MQLLILDFISVKWLQYKFVVCFSSGGVAAHTPKHASHTAGVAQPLRHIARASSSPMLPNTVFTRSSVWQSRDSNPRPCGWIFSMALRCIFGCTSPHSSGWIRPTHCNCQSGRCGCSGRVQELIQASTASAILKYQPPISTSSYENVFNNKSQHTKPN